MLIPIKKLFFLDFLTFAIEKFEKVRYFSAGDLIIYLVD